MAKTRFALLLLAAFGCAGQDSLSLKDAIGYGLMHHPSIAAATEGVSAAAIRTKEAHSGYLPKLDYAESYQRSNNPVFVFSSLLTQHEFGPENFNIGPLNRPDALNNFQSTLVADQVLYDGNRTRSRVRSAEIDHSMTEEERRHAKMAVVAGVAKAFYGVLAATESLKAAEQAVRSAEADLQRAQNVRAAGMSTDADVLSIQVHLAAVREQQIRRTYDVEIRSAALNEAMGAPLDAPHQLSGSLAAFADSQGTLQQYEASAVSSRAEAKQAGLAIDLAETRLQAARSAMLPEVGFRAALEADRQQFISKGGANWLAAVTLRWNLFNGFGDKAQQQAGAHAIEQARSVHRQVASAVQLEVRKAYLNVKSANDRITVAQATVQLAEESLRIVKNRFDNGMTTVTELLRNESALLDARNRYVLAVHDERVALVDLDFSAGTLAADSPLFQ